MPIFYEQAIRASANGKPIEWLRQEHLADWKGLASALDRLTPEQRCDAVYADWLLQLHSPAHQALLQIRNLLIGQGALAANYLAELAQNADDAADGKDAEVRIALDGDWLFVANNGRKVTSMNLLGLSRFFVHAAGTIRELSEETIGRFGIGFKSSYRIASEVLVYTWERNDSFAFRLPICRESEPASHPNHERLNHLRSRLTAAGVDGLEIAFRDVNSLGYCTPEYTPGLPSDLMERTSLFRQSKQGTLFCFHVRQDKLAEVRQRIAGQAHEVYELCPLFLPKLALVQLGPNTLRMVANRAPNADVSGVVEADKATLTTSAPSQSQSSSRFWRLRGVAAGDLWQLALHSDSQHRLRLDLEDDEQGVTLKEGSAYSFYPLNGMNQTWPFRLHLHCKLPTELKRDNWNPADASDVDEQLRRAVRGMVLWLEANVDTLAHGEWGFERLVKQKPAAAMNEGDWPAKWANVIFGELLKAVEDRPLLRSVFGKRVRKSEAQYIHIVENQAARDAWHQLAQAKDLGGDLPAFVPAETAVFGVEAARPDEIGEPFKTILSSQTVSAASRRAAILAYLSTNCHSSGSLERTLAAALVERADGKFAKLGDLMAEPCGTELLPEWHSCFVRLTEWGRDAIWQSAHVFNGRLPEQFRKLSKSVFNPGWAELSTRLSTFESWQTHGEHFWENQHNPCPRPNLADALACLRVPSGDGGWLPLSGLWLDDDTPVNCFAGLLTSWPMRYNHTERKRITDLLKEWGLFAEWEQTTKKALSEKLPGELIRCLAEQASGDAFAVVFSKEFDDARRPLDGGWAYIVNEAEKTAVIQFIHARATEENISGKTVLSSSIAATVRSALCLNAGFVLAPPWLTDAAHHRICRLGLQENLGFEFLSQQDLTANKERFGRELLETFHRWSGDQLNESQAKGLDELCSSCSAARRREWQIRLGPQKQRRLGDLILAGTIHANASNREKLKQKLLDQAEWGRGEQLPTVLTKIQALTEVCIQPTKLELEIKLGTLTPLERDQLPPDLLIQPEINALLGGSTYRLFGSPKPLNIKWRHEGDVVASLDNAEFVIESDQFVVHQYRPPADEKQCQRILNAFETHAVAGADYQADATLAPFERYQKHRDTIRRTLLKELVSKVGYEKHHILRELLQNAESAYASKATKPKEAWFEFVVEGTTSAGRRRICARHAGRAFNETDVAGHERDDVGRIWRLAADSERTADEVGRFNRGFKTVFSVATNGSVRVRSGDFDFEVIDLLMLKPADPKPNPDKHSPLTEFSFEADYTSALEMFRLNAAPGPATALSILNPASFIFLGYLQRITVKFEQRTWEWRINRRVEGNGWTNVTISTDGAPQGESFLVFAGNSTNTSRSRYAAAVRLNANGVPITLEKAWKKFRLTFETEHDFPLDFLVNGDFEADQGRVALRHIARSGLVGLAYNAILQRAQQEIRAKRTKDVWLAWARVLHLKEAATELEAGGELGSLRAQATKTTEFFTLCIPHAGDLVAAQSLIFPSMLFRRLAGSFGNDWGINSADWIDQEIAVALPETEHHKQTFHTWLNGLAPEAPVLRTVQRDLESEKFGRMRFSATEQDELKEAKQVLAEKLRPVAPPEAPLVLVPEIEPWTVANLWHWWERRNKPATDYTLEGNENWRLLYTSDIGDTNERRAQLKSDLRAPASDRGKQIWYRLFGLACLMSAGRRMSELRTFWRTELDGRQFWERTSKATFGEGADALFADVVCRRFANLNASGESAYFWRRIFYDVRKIHKLVWEDEFPITLLELIERGHGGGLLNFLHTGHLPGQQAWAGVFGQSAGTPLFFVVRELCRIGVINDATVRPFAFFVATPVRRAMERIGWLDSDAGSRMDFESLAALSEDLHLKLASDREFGSRLLEFYDIPLLHLGLERDA